MPGLFSVLCALYRLLYMCLAKWSISRLAGQLVINNSNLPLSPRVTQPARRTSAVLCFSVGWGANTVLCLPIGLESKRHTFVSQSDVTNKEIHRTRERGLQSWRPSAVQSLLTEPAGRSSMALETRYGACPPGEITSSTSHNTPPP
jgi:hypothetical protein